MMMTFAAICFLGAGVLILSLILGEFFDVGHDLAAEHGLGEGGGVENVHGGPGVLSSRVISAFLTGFGGAGAIAAHYGKDAMVSSLCGLGAGVLMGGITLTVARFLYGQQATSGVQPSQLAGRTGQVTIGIPAGGTGQVRFEVNGSISDFPAQAAGGKEVPPGASVTVSRVVGGTMIIEPKV